jgi:hypothetical protein
MPVLVLVTPSRVDGKEGSGKYKNDRNRQLQILVWIWIDGYTGYCTAYVVVRAVTNFNTYLYLLTRKNESYFCSLLEQPQAPTHTEAETKKSSSVDGIKFRRLPTGDTNKCTNRLRTQFLSTIMNGVHIKSCGKKMDDVL